MKIIERHINQEILMQVAKKLGIKSGKVVLIEDEQEADFLVDFALYDIRDADGKTVVQLYQETEEAENEIESQLLTAMTSSPQCSLFKIIEISSTKGLLTLVDCFNPQSRVQIMDFNLSQTAILESLLFIRMLSLPEFNMSSGFGFVFDPNSEIYLLRRYKALSRKVKSENESVKKFVAFFQLNRTLGLGLSME